MKYWKTILLIFLVFAFLSTGGCKKADNNQKAESQEKIFRVAILVVSDTYLPLSVEGLKEGMLTLGYREGENIRYSIYNAQEDTSRLKPLAREIVDSRPDVICPSINPAIEAVRETGTDLPVVFLESMYPVEFGMVKSLTNPGTNYTGVSNMTGPMSGKRLELLLKMIPGIKRVAVISNPDNAVSKLSLKTTKEAAADLDLQLDIHLVDKPEEVDETIAKIESSPVDALTLLPDFMVFSRLERIAAMAKKKKIPTMAIDRTQAEKGLLASYGGGLYDIARQAARHVDRIFKGESPANIPIEQPYRYNLFINMKTAEEIGVTLPEEILYQAAGYYR